MRAPQQWLVIPKDPNVRCYLTENREVVEKRIKKGDVIEAIDRDAAPQPDDEDEL